MPTPREHTSIGVASGNYAKPGDRVYIRTSPSGPLAPRLPALAIGWARARCLFASENPLRTATRGRKRYWQSFFGMGIVKPTEESASAKGENQVPVGHRNLARMLGGTDMCVDTTDMAGAWVGYQGRWDSRLCLGPASSDLNRQSYAVSRILWGEISLTMPCSSRFGLRSHPSRYRFRPYSSLGTQQPLQYLLQ